LTLNGSCGYSTDENLPKLSVFLVNNGIHYPGLGLLGVGNLILFIVEIDRLLKIDFLKSKRVGVLILDIFCPSYPYGIVSMTRKSSFQ